jgi:hypothetical protein
MVETGDVSRPVALQGTGAFEAKTRQPFLKKLSVAFAMFGRKPDPTSM